MYQIIVDEIKEGKTLAERQTGSRGRGHLAEEKCRISALSSADFCLGRRQETARGQFQWTGSGKAVRRLFAAERLSEKSLELLDSGKNYLVMFLGQPGRGCA